MTRFILFAFLASLIAAQSFATSRAKPIDVSVCEIAAQPKQYDGKLLRVRATIIPTHHATALEDPKHKCEFIGMTFARDEANRPTGSTSNESLSSNSPPIALRRDGNFRRFLRLSKVEMYPLNRTDICEGCYRYQMTATFIGVLDANVQCGLNCYSPLLIAASVSEISPKDTSTEWDPRKYTTKLSDVHAGYLVGKLVGPKGERLDDADVSAVAVSETDFHSSEAWQYTDDKGRFKFTVTPGTYIIVVNRDYPIAILSPFGTTYYPGTAQRSSATPITVGDHQTIRNLVITLPQALPLKKIPILVVRPDGSPVEGAHAWLTIEGKPNEIIDHAPETTDAKGVTELKGFAQFDYVLWGDNGPNSKNERSCATPIRILANQRIPEKIVVTLALSGSACSGIQ